MKSEQEIELEQVIKHPDYVFDTLKNDICLIKEKFKKNPISYGLYDVTLDYVTFSVYDTYTLSCK